MPHIFFFFFRSNEESHWIHRERYSEHAMAQTWKNFVSSFIVNAQRMLTVGTTITANIVYQFAYMRIENSVAATIGIGPMSMCYPCNKRSLLGEREHDGVSAPFYTCFNRYRVCRLLPLNKMLLHFVVGVSFVRRCVFISFARTIHTATHCWWYDKMANT